MANGGLDHPSSTVPQEFLFLFFFKENSSQVTQEFHLGLLVCFLKKVLQNKKRDFFFLVERDYFLQVI